MQYHYEKPSLYLSTYGQVYECDYTVYSRCTLYLINDKGLAVIQQRYDPDTKKTWWGEIDEWLTNSIYLHLKFRVLFEARADTCKDGLYPTVTLRQIM